MPMYEYRCRQCGDVFEARRSMSDADSPVTCPSGHDSAVRLLSVFASTGRSAGGAPAMAGVPSGGGCGAACGCHG